MIGKIKNIISLLLLLVFLLPTIVKLEHHHEHEEWSEHSHGTAYHEFHGKCAVCEFEFSVFMADPVDPQSREENPDAGFFNHYESADYSNLSAFSFQLRGPPLLTHHI